MLGELTRGLRHNRELSPGPRSLLELTHTVFPRPPAFVTETGMYYMILVDSVSRAPSPIQGTSKRLAYSVRGQLVSRPVGNLCHVRGLNNRAVADLTVTPRGLPGTPRGASLTGLLSASQSLSSNRSRRRRTLEWAALSLGRWLTEFYFTPSPPQ